MPGDTVVQGAQPVEYVEETSFATDETDPAMNWFGLVDTWTVTQGVEAETVRYLPGSGSSEKLETLQNVKVSEAYTVEASIMPQDLSILKYFTGANGGTSDSLTPIQAGEQDEDNGEYRRIKGMVGEEMVLTIEEDSVATLETTFLAADANNWSGSDYVGAGSHATEDTSTPLTYDDLGSVNLGGSSLGDAVESLTLTVSNDLEVVKDPDATPQSHIAAIAPTSREITVELALTYDDFSMAQDVRNYNAQDLTFTFQDSFTVSDTKYPEFPYEMGPDDLVGDTVASDPATNLAWS
jgi:hypothetical protein